MHKGWNFSKQLKNMLEHFGRLLAVVADGIDTHWKRVNEDMKQEKMQSISSKFLMKLKLENNPRYESNLTEVYNLSGTVLRFAQACINSASPFWNEELYSERGAQHLVNLTKILTVPRESLVLSMLDVIMNNISKSAKEIRTYLQNANHVFNTLMKQTLRLLFSSFSSKEFLQKFFDIM